MLWKKQQSDEKFVMAKNIPTFIFTFSKLNTMKGQLRWPEANKIVLYDVYNQKEGIQPTLKISIQNFGFYSTEI